MSQKEYIVEFGTTLLSERVFIIDIYEDWDKENSKPQTLVTTFYHHHIRQLLIDAKKHISKPQAKRVVECIRNRQARMVISHTGFALWGGNIHY